MKSATALLTIWLAATAALGQDRESPLKPVEPESAGRSLVIVEIQLRVRDDLSRGNGSTVRVWSPDAQQKERLRKLATPLEFPGVVVRPGEVIFAEPRLEPEDYGEVRIRTWDGRRHAAKLAGVLSGTAGMRATFEPAEGTPEPVAFRSPDRLEFTALRAVWLDSLLDRIVLRSTTASLDGLEVEGGIFTENPFPGGALLLDRKGRPVGVSLGGYLQARRTGAGYDSTFLGADILGEKVMAREELDRAYARIRERVSASLVRVKIEYRLPGKDEARGYRSGGGDNLGDDEAFGIMFRPGLVFLPIDPGYKKIRQLSRVIALAGDDEIEGTFVGSYREYEGLVIEFPDLEGTLPAEILDVAPPGRFQHFFVATPERKFGADRIRLTSARILGEDVVIEREEERRRPRLAIAPAPGAFFTDAEGRIFGLVSREKEEGEEPGSRGPYGGSSHMNKPPRVFWTRDLAPGWSSPEDLFDPRARPRTRLMARRLVWLGVEYQYIPKPLAKEIGVQDATRDGERGLLVNMVYEGSPAAKAGIQPGDVLLYVLEKGKTEAEKKEFLRPAYFAWRNNMNRYGGFNFAPRTNELTRLLTGLGEGREVVLRWARGTEEKETELVLAQAPADFESAMKWKDEKLGMTVRELTYEVCAFYRIPRDFQGVVVSRIESGSPAEVAGMEAMAILESINGERISSVDGYRALVGRALDDGVAALTFLIKRLEGTRFVEVKPIEEDSEEKKD